MKPHETVSFTGEYSICGDLDLFVRNKVVNCFQGKQNYNSAYSFNAWSQQINNKLWLLAVLRIKTIFYELVE